MNYAWCSLMGYSISFEILYVITFHSLCNWNTYTQLCIWLSNFMYKKHSLCIKSTAPCTSPKNFQIMFHPKHFFQKGSFSFFLFLVFNLNYRNMSTTKIVFSLDPKPQFPTSTCALKLRYIIHTRFLLREY